MFVLDDRPSATATKSLYGMDGDITLASEKEIWFLGDLYGSPPRLFLDLGSVVSLSYFAQFSTTKRIDSILIGYSAQHIVGRASI